MAEKDVSPSDLQGETAEAVEKMECEDVVSGTGSVEMKTDSEKVTVSLEKSPSPMTSDTTSGLEMRFDTPAGTPSGAEAVPLATTPAACPTAEASSPPQKPGKISAFGAIRKILSPPRDKVQDADSASPKDKSRYGAGMSFLRNRFRASKSLSPPERSLETAIEEEPSDTAESSVSDDRGTQSAIAASPQKKYMGIGSKIKKSLSSMAGFFSSNKGIATSQIPEAVGLIAEAETKELTAGAGALKVELDVPEAEENAEEETTPKFQPYWQDACRSSLNSSHSDVTQTLPDTTQMTDAPSVYSDVFAAEDEALSKASSEAAEEMILDSQEVPETADIVGETSVDAAVESQEVSDGRDASENQVTVVISEESSMECQTSPSVQEVSEDSKAERTPVKRQAETPAEVLIQEGEGGATGTPSPCKKPKVPEEQSVPEEDKRDDGEMTQDT